MIEQNAFQRTQLLLGDSNINKLHSCSVIIFGVGGVGSWCAESLIRSGIQHLTIVDYDTIAESNINRQVMATSTTVGHIKVEILRNRLLEINPKANIIARQEIFNAETLNDFDFDQYDYLIDCIDSLKNKILLLVEASKSRAKIFSSMGSALKIDITKIKVAEFWKVNGCPFASIIRKRMRQTKMLPYKKITCVYSPEVSDNLGKTIDAQMECKENIVKKAQINGTLAHITAIFGFSLAGLLIKDIVENNK